MIDINEENMLGEETLLLISRMEKELESKNNEINELKNKLAYLENQILNKNRMIFGKSSEQVDSNQLSLFDEAEINSDSKATEPTTEEITYTRKKSSITGKKDNLINLERVVIEHKLGDDEAMCNKCNVPLTVIGSKSKEILKYVPAKLYIEEHVTYSYACKSCEVETDKANIVTTEAPKTILHKSMASNEILAHVLSLKYMYSMPLYRQETYFKMLNVNLSRQTLSNWIMGAANELELVNDFMRKKLIERDYIQADETTLKVIDDNGKDSKSKKYMWMYRSGGCIAPIILYDYQRTRSSSCPREFLKGFSGYLQTDGYNGYNKVENIKRLYCLAHIRRKFYEVIADLDDETLKKSRAIIGFNYCEKLYSIEKELRTNYSNNEDYYEKRNKIRLEQSSSILEEFIQYTERELKDALPKSPLGRALDYAHKLLPSMRIFLEYGALEIDNNASERAIKPFVIGRKNWLFSNTSKGAKASALIYSIIETSKANGLIVEKYLVYLFDRIANCESIDDEFLDEIVPWANNLPEELKTKTNK